MLQVMKLFLLLVSLTGALWNTVEVAKSRFSMKPLCPLTCDLRHTYPSITQSAALMSLDCAVPRVANKERRGQCIDLLAVWNPDLKCHWVNLPILRAVMQDSEVLLSRPSDTWGITLRTKFAWLPSRWFSNQFSEFLWDVKLFNILYLFLYSWCKENRKSHSCEGF